MLEHSTHVSLATRSIQFREWPCICRHDSLHFVRFGWTITQEPTKVPNEIAKPLFSWPKKKLEFLCHYLSFPNANNTISTFPSLQVDLFCVCILLSAIMECKIFIHSVDFSTAQFVFSNMKISFYFCGFIPGWFFNYKCCHSFRRNHLIE